jgi:hypothetical protein
MIMAIRITQLAPLPSVAFIAPVAAEVTTATVSLPLFNEGSDFWETPPKLKSASIKAFFFSQVPLIFVMNFAWHDTFGQRRYIGTLGKIIFPFLPYAWLERAKRGESGKHTEQTEPALPASRTFSE